jgi:drug/metabolite transporter (DMT)-like permease
MPSRISQRHLGILMVTASAVAWSTTGLFTRALPLDTGSLLVWRGLFGALGLCVVLALMQGRAGFARFARLGRAGWAYAVISALGMLCFITSLRLTSVAHVAIIYAVVPFLAATLGWLLLREVPSRTALIASAVAFAGASWMIGFSADGHISGDLLAFGMTLAMALMMVIARRHPGIPTLPAATLSALLASLAALPFATTPGIPLEHLPMLAAFGLTNSALGIALFLMGSARIAPVETALIGALDAPLAPLWVWLIFAEIPSQATLTGGTIVMLAVIWHILRSSHPR